MFQNRENRTIKNSKEMDITKARTVVTSEKESV